MWPLLGRMCLEQQELPEGACCALDGLDTSTEMCLHGFSPHIKAQHKCF